MTPETILLVDDEPDLRAALRESLQEDGYAVVGRMIILASDHAHGVFLPFDLGRRYSPEELQANIRKFVSVE